MSKIFIISDKQSEQILVDSSNVILKKGILQVPFEDVNIEQFYNLNDDKTIFYLLGEKKFPIAKLVIIEDRQYLEFPIPDKFNKQIVLTELFDE
jgi:hypothetical protein